MRYQDQLVRMTQRSLEDLCRAVSAMPPTLVDWRPSGDARSVLSQMREIASSGEFFLPILGGQEMGSHQAKDMGAIESRMEKFETMEQCIEAARKVTGEICSIIAEVADDDLEREIVLPFGEGALYTMADVCGMHYWNLVYHLGQVNQIQLMLGDRRMH